jgi:hypothetical protein
VARHTFADGVEVAICAEHLSSGGRTVKERVGRVQAMRKYALAFGNKEAGSVALYHRAVEKAGEAGAIPLVLDSGLEDAGLLDEIDETDDEGDE